MLAEVAPHGAVGQCEAVALGGEHLDQLAAPDDQRGQGLVGRVGQRARFGPDARGKEGEDVGVDRIGFGEAADRLREIAHLARIDDGHGEAGQGQGAGARGFIAARCFEHDEGGTQGAEVLHERGQPALVIRHARLGGGRVDGDIDVSLRYVEAHVDWSGHRSASAPRAPNLAMRGLPEHLSGLWRRNERGTLATRRFGRPRAVRATALFCDAT